MLAKLNKKLPTTVQASTHNPPFIFTLIKKCRTYNIQYELMSRLNYYDLLYLVVEYDIEAIKENLRQMEDNRRQQMGYEVVEASNDQILAMHKV